MAYCYADRKHSPDTDLAIATVAQLIALLLYARNQPEGLINGAMFLKSMDDNLVELI